ncbi:hypothetical protein [Nonomuraea roseola]|uniref:Response regulator transcription factor n=1 Tax=Nonomuraea roseola TaxID=46179 RepID=A0ABV5Q9X5_9ACTN
MIIWVVIADERSAVRDVLRMMLDGEPDIEVVGQAADERVPPEYGRNGPQA